MKNNVELDHYLFFSSLELIQFFYNNLVEKNIKVQTKRIFEMARVFMTRKNFEFEDIYSVLIMVRDISYCSEINEVCGLYFKNGRYPIRVFLEISDLEDTSDIEIEFSAFRGERKYINSDNKYALSANSSQGVIIENYVHVSSVPPINPVTQKVVDGDFKQQIRQCLENLKEILEIAGTSLEKTYTFMVYLNNLEQLPLVEEVFIEYSLEKENIQQEVMKVNRLKGNYEMEISCSAYLS